MNMADCTNHLYIASFAAGGDSGLAFISAPSERVAISILKNTGRYNGSPDMYRILQIRDIGMSSNIRNELLMESYVNALVAFDAIVSATTPYIGPVGPQGTPGKDAGFGVVSADVDETSGDPSVDVVMTGEDSEKNIAFHFHGIKGRKGDTGISVQSVEQTTTATTDGGINIVTVTLDNGDTAEFQVKNGKVGLESVNAYVDSLPGQPSVITSFDSGELTMSFYGLKGMQGNPGINNTVMSIVTELPEPSASIANTVCLIYNSETGDYDRYIIVTDGVTYSWEQAGDMSIDLSDYKRTDSDVWLTREEFDAIEIKDITKTYNIYEEQEEP